MRASISFLLLIIIPFFAKAQKSISYAKEIGNTIMNMWKDSLSSGNKPAKWRYDQDVILQGMQGLWKATGTGRYFSYIQKSIDRFLDEDGNISTYTFDNLTLDNIAPGRDILLLYNVTGKKKYLNAVNLLRKQLNSQPRTHEGGFWHKKIYPNQMWLDGLFMAEPFYTEYANTFHEDSDYSDIAKQFILMERNARDIKTGLLYHGYDASKQEKWANKQTGLSSNFWARAMGWYGMGLVDVLEDFPQNVPERKDLIGILNRFAVAIAKVQDKKTGLWWDVLDKPGKEKNYPEASASCMFVYVLAKGVRLGYLPPSYLTVAKKGYNGIIKNFIKRDANGQLNLNGTVSVSGLGGHLYRDGSYDYYTSEKIAANDPKGVGAFLLASNEIEMLPTLALGKGNAVLLDNYFNHETKKDITGKTVQWHYVWNEMDNGGYSMFGNIFHKYGVRTKSIPVAPTSNNLKNSNIYIIVDPDTDKENERPNYIENNDINAIYNWVKAGGVLLLFSNDSGNAEFAHLNRLAAKFGIQFNYDSKNKETGTNFEMAAVNIPAGNTIFKDVKKVYIKEYSSLSVKAPAAVMLKQDENNVIAVAKVGKGTVFAIGDPWFYNEYEDGRKIPMDFENYKASEDLVKWVIAQTK
ncbi:glycoside hydrolase family 88 protein [Ginsengibacter hankyongi]|uniref:Glycoside hydrolase family 88 protein n=1 Tax=Ginsengibacter hankyongi TaxID=2607284 RepID=A0A5J5IE19_9BACT|nr:glycoside hydrolase family 88 protein [Ginsengibacter hankyongi]KAA9038057.1 glycoside hydrolase family 88 protein [Ginsengibacter hankyongi]